MAAGEIGQIRVNYKSRYLALGFGETPERTKAAFRPDPQDGTAPILIVPATSSWAAIWTYLLLSGALDAWRFCSASKFAKLFNVSFRETADSLGAGGKSTVLLRIQ